ncbi:zinc finger HIT domain-containing protein 2-like [Asterias rubens]|uniref:zinc finger HIT domain-containing protein 2-like n=1 Tax=Asterias rubens TaxID=7604 RepID=UPI001455A9CF|nr:zinc finger HIT domain-containing protein 2-like [Asterias rubens]
MAAPTVRLTAENPSKETGAGDDSTAVCDLCLKNSSKYRCPRCSAAYCSLACYQSQKHSGCSEKFSREHFQEVLKNKKGSAADRKKMLEILERVETDYKPLFQDDEEEDEEGDEETEGGAASLEERIAGLDLDVDIDEVWERLTDKEKRDFETVLHAGKLGALVPIWKPWWESHEADLIKVIDNDPPPSSKAPPQPPRQPSYIDEIEEDLEKVVNDLGIKDDQTTDQDLVEEAASSNPPKILKKIAKLSEVLRSKKASDSVIYNLLNILYSYAYVVRLYNGAHRDLPIQLAKNLLELSATLSHNVNFTDTEESLASAVHNASISLFNSNTFSSSILRDVTHLLLGQASDSPTAYIQSALSDMHRLFGAARKQLAKENKNSSKNSEPEENRSSKDSKGELHKTCFNCQKKLEFFLAWNVEHKDEPRMLIPEVEAMYRSRQASEEQHNLTKSAFEMQWGDNKPPPKPKNRLIEELS